MMPAYLSNQYMDAENIFLLWHIGFGQMGPRKGSSWAVPEEEYGKNIIPDTTQVSMV